jgi:hypothetical protein
MNNRRAPTAEVFIGEVEGFHVGLFRQNRVNRAAQVADAFAVDDAHAQNAAPLTLGQVIRHEVLDLARLKRVQVQHAVNRQFHD